jgi:hypothetical protein
MLRDHTEEREMLHRSKIWVAVVLTAALTCTPLAIAGNNGDPMTITKFQSDTQITDQHLTNDCNGDDVAMNGTMHFDYFLAQDADGDRTHYDLTTTLRLTGVGYPSGANYVAVEKTHQEDITRNGQASDTRNTFKERLVAQGKTPDMIRRDVLHVVIDRNGNIRVNVDKSTVSCK